MFRSPSIPAPPPVPQADEAQQRAQEEIRRTRRGGRQAYVLTGAGGLADPGQVGRKTALGA